MSNPVRQLDIISAMIGEARLAVQEGTPIDLAEIQGLVQEVCASIHQSPPEDGEEVHEKIEKMIADLNILADELKEHQKVTGADVIRRAVQSSYKRDPD